MNTCLIKSLAHWLLKNLGLFSHLKRGRGRKIHTYSIQALNKLLYWLHLSLPITWQSNCDLSQFTNRDKITHPTWPVAELTFEALYLVPKKRISPPSTLLWCGNNVLWNPCSIINFSIIHIINTHRLLGAYQIPGHMLTTFGSSPMFPALTLPRIITFTFRWNN